MRTLYAIYRKEMRHYFVSPIAWIVVGVFLIFERLVFQPHLVIVIQQSLQAMMHGMQYGGAENFDVPGRDLRAFLGVHQRPASVRDAHADHGRICGGAQARNDGAADDLAGDAIRESCLGNF